MYKLSVFVEKQQKLSLTPNRISKNRYDRLNFLKNYTKQKVFCKNKSYDTDIITHSSVRIFFSKFDISTF